MACNLAEPLPDLFSHLWLVFHGCRPKGHSSAYDCPGSKRSSFEPHDGRRQYTARAETVFTGNVVRSSATPLHAPPCAWPSVTRQPPFNHCFRGRRLKPRKRRVNAIPVSISLHQTLKIHISENWMKFRLHFSQMITMFTVDYLPSWNYTNPCFDILTIYLPMRQNSPEIHVMRHKYNVNPCVPSLWPTCIMNFGLIRQISISCFMPERHLRSLPA